MPNVAYGAVNVDKYPQFTLPSLETLPKTVFIGQGEMKEFTVELGKVDGREAAKYILENLFELTKP